MKFTINSEEWEMTEVDSCAIELVGEERPNLGVCAFNTNKIFIRKQLPPSKKPVVVRHELAHAFLNSTQLGYKDKYEDEELCEFVGKYADKINEIAERFIKEVEVKR